MAAQIAIGAVGTMTRLDRYVLQRYVQWLGMSILALWLVAFVVNLNENIDMFIDHEATLGQFARYYAYRTPYWIILTLPVAVLLSTLFCLTSMARRNEITAAKAAGISLHRLLLPLFVFGLCFSGLAFVFTDFVVPVATKRYNDVRDDIRSYRRSDGSRRQVLLQDTGGQLLSARSYEHAKQRAHHVLWEQRQNAPTTRRVAGRLLQWRGEERGWVVLDGHEFRFADGEPKVTAFDSLALSSLSLVPDDLARQRRKPEEMNYRELRAYIDRAVANGEDATRNLVELHLKIAFPLTCFVILLLGAPVAANARGGRANSFGIGVLICFVFYSCVKAGQALGWNAVIDPWLGAWIANLLFGVLGAFMMRRAHT